MVQKKYKIGLIGAGHMGTALLAGWLGSRTAEPGEIVVSDTNRSGLKSTVKKFGIHGAKNNGEVVASSETVVLAVKPQVMDGVLDGVAKVAAGKTLFISIVAGFTLARMEGKLGREIGAVRVMPNTPALIGEGISALSFNRQVTGKEKERAMGLMGAVG
ncbi:MAG: NAD(P)-binding domain-containing protein, partial [bacterium]|nr:NAD(P)-binding domain-containing protein [bacterium]